MPPYRPRRWPGTWTETPALPAAIEAIWVPCPLSSRGDRDEVLRTLSAPKPVTNQRAPTSLRLQSSACQPPPTSHSPRKLSRARPEPADSREQRALRPDAGVDEADHHAGPAASGGAAGRARRRRPGSRRAGARRSARRATTRGSRCMASAWSLVRGTANPLSAVGPLVDGCAGSRGVQHRVLLVEQHRPLDPRRAAARRTPPARARRGSRGTACDRARRRTTTGQARAPPRRARRRGRHRTASCRNPSAPCTSFGEILHEPVMVAGDWARNQRVPRLGPCSRRRPTPRWWSGSIST